MDALPAPQFRSAQVRSTQVRSALADLDGHPDMALGLSPEDAQAWQQQQTLAQAAVQPWVFAIAVVAMTLAVGLLLWLGRANARPDVDSAELLVPLTPSSADDRDRR